MCPEKDTKCLEDELSAVRSLDELDSYLKENNSSLHNRGSYSDWLYKKQDEYDQAQRSLGNDARLSLWEKSYLSKSYYYALKAGTKIPSRETVIKIGLALGLSVDEMNKSLKLAGWKELYPRNPSDACICFGIKEGLTMEEIGELLEDRIKDPTLRINLFDKE